MSKNLGPAAKKALVADWFGRAASVYFSPFFSYPGQRLVEFAKVQRGVQVLDVCTGNGAVLLPAALAVGVDGYVTGIDFAEEMVKASSSTIMRKDVLNAAVRQMDAEHLDFPDASFDCVLCGFALSYITDIQRALGEIQRVLKPGSTLALSTWGEGSELATLYRALEVEFNIVQPDLESHHLGTVEALNRLLESSGFSNVKITAETVKVIFDNKQEYWAQRMPIEQIAMEDLDPAGASFRRAVYDMLEDFLYIDGVHEVRNVLYAVAST